ncbi:MAG: copper resistance protein CopC [Acidimicrobiales bacterium]|nr:MAG: copper resistance protein CopC [Acidimicrobiales bacterium]
MTTSTGFRRALLALAAAFGALLVAPATAHAHTDFDYSLPADGASVGEPVEEITVAFTLPVTLVGNGFAVLDPQNNELAPVAATDDDTVFRLRFDPPLAGGTAAVKYEVQAEDGHVLTGNFVFEVDAQPPTEVPAATAPPTSADTPATTSTDAPAVTSSTTLATTTTDSDEDDGVSATWVLAAIAAAIALGAAGFLLVRSRTGDA